jgi:hypothetical protein
MTKRIVLLGMSSLLMCTGMFANADSHAPPPPGLMETYGCMFKQGKDMDDLMAARDYYVKQADKAGIKLNDEFVWTQIKGSAPVDFIWLAPHQSLAAFAAATDAAAASDEMASAEARFNEVVSCQAQIGAARIIYQPDPMPERVDPALVSTSACNYKHGRSSEDMPDLVGHIRGVMGEMGDAAPNFAFGVAPITGGPDSADVYLAAAFSNATHWANWVQGLGSSESGARLGRHFDTMLDCSRAMWSSTRVVEGAEE